jgi:DNA-binding NarL/FixJ family response regulator
MLTSREIEILKYITLGGTAAAFAAEHALSVRTVEAHIYNIKNKLGISRAVNLTHYAIRTGLIKLKTLEELGISTDS